jgi:hypothetical protein
MESESEHCLLMLGEAVKQVSAFGFSGLPRGFCVGFGSSLSACWSKFWYFLRTLDRSFIGIAALPLSAAFVQVK